MDALPAKPESLLSRPPWAAYRLPARLPRKPLKSISKVHD
jgi:hypothetical protein